jgi:hypothetical protein
LTIFTSLKLDIGNWFLLAISVKEVCTSLYGDTIIDISFFSLPVLHSLEMLFRHHLYLLLQVTEECLERGIAVCTDGASFKKIGKRIRYYFSFSYFCWIQKRTILLWLWYHIRVMVGCSFSQFDTQIKQQYLNLLFFRSDGSLPSVMVGFRLINCNGFIWIEDGSCMEIHEKLKSCELLADQFHSSILFSSIINGIITDFAWRYLLKYHLNLTYLWPIP